MTRHEIKLQLTTKYKAFTDFVLELSEEDYQYAPTAKWNAGQQLDHLNRSVKPLSKGLSLPKLIVRLLFGKANRPSKTYEELVRKYQSKLQAGGKASGKFIPSIILPDDRSENTDKLLRKIEKLNNHIESYSEEQMDSFILPHPLLGKVTLREMMYFTIYHAEHHQTLIEKYLTINGE